MAARLKKRDGTETLTFEVFDLEVDDADRQRLAEEPRGFLNALLEEEEGTTVNGLFLDSHEKFQGTGGAEPLTRSVWHCTGPRKMASRIIVVISKENGD